MPRISDLGFQQILLQNFQRIQGAAQERQIQLASGKISTAYSGVGAGTNRLLSAEGVIARASAYEDAAKVAATRLQTQETAMTNIGDAVADLRQRFVAVLATGSAELVTPEVETAAQRVLASLNTQLGGVYVFGGSDGTTKPAGAASLADIGAAADPNDLFDPTATHLRLTVEEGTTVDGGPLAQEIGADLMALFHDFANAGAALGPFAGELTAAQRDYLVNMVAELDAISADLNTALGVNGVAQSQADAARTRNVQRRDLAEQIASGIEDIDIAEVVARLSQDQIAIEASARALAQATQLSLLNYI
ncbi:MAG: flagellin [Pseudomonadota bacterium]|nr:flagellin [Pseudomonadota bacterium]